MADTIMATVKAGGVCNVQMTHEFTEISQRRQSKKVLMIVHQNKTVQNNSISFY